MFDRMPFTHSWRGIVVAVAVLGFDISGCASHPRTATPGSDSRMDERSAAQDCQRAANEAVRLRNSAVSAYNSGRRDAALALFDQSVEMWRQITNGALHCSQDTVTLANERLDQAMRERDDMTRSAR
jgi:hypothetical protein